MNSGLESHFEVFHDALRRIGGDQKAMMVLTWNWSMFVNQLEILIARLDSGAWNEARHAAAMSEWRNTAMFLQGGLVIPLVDSNYQISAAGQRPNPGICDR